MYRVIIVDDEPLILTGVASLIEWEEYGCSIIAKATNGLQAYELIKEMQPDIVITDIKMPVMDGIELMEKCKQEEYNPFFIVLTNLEEFNLAKMALALGAVDYQVKIELTEDSLKEGLKRAITLCDKYKDKNNNISRRLSKYSNEELIKYYFKKQLLGEENPLAESELSFHALNIESRFTEIMLLKFYIEYPPEQFLEILSVEDKKKNMSYTQSILQEMVKRFFRESCLFEWEKNQMIIIISIKDIENYREVLINMCNKMKTVTKDYFEANLVVGISEAMPTTEQIQEMFLQGSHALEFFYYNSSSPIIFYTKDESHSKVKHHRELFDINFLKNDLSLAIQQNNSEKLYGIIQQIIELFEEYKPSKSQSIDACANLYYFVAPFYNQALEGGDNTFAEPLKVINHLNQLTNRDSIIQWIHEFRYRLCEKLESSKTTKTNKLVELAKRYVELHYTEKLALGTVAEELSVSHGYLSSVFKKYTGSNFSDYISYVKIEKGKELIQEYKYMMYEISDLLGFENPYYFSKVFKKVTGMTPKDYELSLLNKRG